MYLVWADYMCVHLFSGDLQGWFLRAFGDRDLNHAASSSNLNAGTGALFTHKSQVLPGGAN